MTQEKEETIATAKKGARKITADNSDMSTNASYLESTRESQQDGRQPDAVGKLTEEDNYCLWHPEDDVGRPRFVYHTVDGVVSFGTAVGPCGGRAGAYPYDAQRKFLSRGPILGKPIAAWHPATPEERSNGRFAGEELTGEELDGPGLDPAQDVRLVVAGSLWPRLPDSARWASRKRQRILDVPDKRPITYALLSGRPPQFDYGPSLSIDPYYGTLYDKATRGSRWRPPFYRNN